MHMKESKKKSLTNILKIKCFSIKKNGFSHFLKNVFCFYCFFVSIVPADLKGASELLISKPHSQISNQPFLSGANPVGILRSYNSLSIKDSEDL